MNMHGVMVPRTDQAADTRLQKIRYRVSDLYARYRAFLLVVMLPTSLVAGYYYLIASDQYMSEAHILVRNAGPQSSGGIGISQALSAATGMSAAQGEAISIADYLSSHDAVASLSKSFDLVSRFQRPDIDYLSRLHGANPTPERVLKYYHKQVEIKYNTETGITSVIAKTFRPEDSYELVQHLLALGERRVNTLNERSYADSISTTSKQLAATEKLLAANQAQFTHYRQSRGDIDPKASGEVQLSLVSGLTGALANAKAQLVAMGRAIDRSSPQYIALADRVRALEAQVNAQSARVAGGGSAIAADVGGYEDLRMRQGFLQKQYEADMAALDKARDQAQRQHLYVVRVVAPNRPVKSTYPERGRVVLTVFVGLLVIYAIGWLIVAGTREHAL